MNLIFEPEPEGLAGEPARARVYLKLTGLYVVIGLLLWNITDWIGLRVLAGMCLLGAVIAGAKSIFHLTTIGVIKLPDKLQTPSQIVVALLAASLPVFYFLQHVNISSDLFQYNLTSWALWVATLFVVYLSYKAASILSPPLLPVRSYLVAVSIAFLLAFVAGHGGFSSGDEEGGSYDTPYIDPETPEGQLDMANNYFRIIAASYLGLTVSLLRKKRTSRSLDAAQSHLTQPEKP